MTWMFFVLLSCLCQINPPSKSSPLSSVVAAVRLRENENVLVPSNDVNLKAKIKKAINGDVDVVELKEVGVEKIKEKVKNPKVEKLIVDQLERGTIQSGENEISVVAADAAVNLNENSTTTEIFQNETVTTQSFNYTTDFFITTSSSVQYNYSTNSTAAAVTDISTSTTNYPPWSNSTYNSTQDSTSKTPYDSTTTYNSTTSDNSTAEVSTVTSSTESLNDTSTQQGNSTSTKSATTLDNISNSTAPPPPTIKTPVRPEIKINDCILSVECDMKPKWISVEGKLVVDEIKAEDGSVEIYDSSWKFESQNDYRKFMKIFTFQKVLMHVKYLSMAFNNLTELPEEIFNLWNGTLSHLSLAGNDFGASPDYYNITFKNLPSLRQLDLRNCRLKDLKLDNFKRLTNLEYLDVSNNEITDILPESFPPSLLHIDLSHNLNPSSTIQVGMKLPENIFKKNLKLISIDFSYTKIEELSINSLLGQMPPSLNYISLCYVQLPDVNYLFGNSSKIEILDLSGNQRFLLNSEKFKFIKDSIEFLKITNSNVKSLEWAKDLKNLKLIDLYDNSINSLDVNSFSHMEQLVKLDLEKNSIGNWYETVFSNNHKLEILNLRENKLTKLTNDMQEDFLGVSLLGFGKNEFECSCVLETFSHKLFHNTKVANITANRRVSQSIEFDIDDSKTLTTRVSLASRSADPRYDIIYRTLQKYYKMAEASVTALTIREVKSSGLVMRKGNVNMNDADEGSNNDNYSPTLLFDYNEDDDDYVCINATAKEKKPIIELDLCLAEENEKDDENYNNPSASRINALTIVSASFTSVIIVCILSIVLYWKWWYVKYFFVLCKNSAILTFMEDTPEKDAIISKRASRASIDTYIYDVFVSYSEQNRDWVLSEFIPNVEKRESINICLHERDFTVGSSILENIISCMDQSRCLLLLVSSDFLQSQWCLFEMNLAQHRLLETRREKLILVLLEDIPTSKQPRTLKYLMRTKTYIKWPQNGGKEEKNIFWRRLKKAIISSKWENDNYGSSV